MFEQLKDEILLTDCKAAVQLEKRSTARVLEYLSEIDQRRLWLKEGYSSLYDFCIRYLNYSEGETHRRIQACRLAARVEEVKPLLEEGTLSLTSMSLLAPYLDSENAKEILPKVVAKSSRQVEKVIQEHFPETKKKSEMFKAELDEELALLLEKAKLLASEKEPSEFLRKVLKDYLRERKTRSSEPKYHTRYVQKSLAKEVKERADYQCTYVSPKGVRCNQRAHLEVDHIRPFAKGGSSRDPENLRVLCRAHNLFCAKQDFPEFRVSSEGVG